MRIHLVSALFLLTLVAAGHQLSRMNSWYYEVWYADIVLHITAGAMFALLWLWLAHSSMPASSGIVFLTLIMAGVFGSFLWEVWEFGWWQHYPERKALYDPVFYSPTVSDTLGDILSGLGGGTLVALWGQITNKRS